MRLSQIAAQLYTVRDFCKTSADLAASVKKLRSIGYHAVQVSGVGPIDEIEIAAICRSEGLTICATHEDSHLILDQPSKAAERVRKLGSDYCAYPWPRDVQLDDPVQLASLIKRLDAAGAVFRHAELTLGYHNHAIEFQKIQGRTVLEHIFAETEPKNLVAELDTYWIQYGGGDVVEWCERLSGRLPTMHLKDYGFTRDNTPIWTEIGRGTLNFKRIIAAAEKSGCRWFIVEQDTCPGDPFESLKISFDYMAANLAQN